jgi:hypothetical protein
MKLPHRRRFLHLAAGAAALPTVSRSGWAQTYPARPVRIIVGFGSGSAFDILARLMGHVWTAPAVQEESDHQRSVRVRSCIRPVVAWRITSVAMQPLWPLALM